MYQIKTDDELIKTHLAGIGFIYNDYSGKQKINPTDTGNKLHSANCPYVEKCDTKTNKYFFESIDEARKWLNGNRGKEDENWKVCKKCSPS